MEGWWGGEGGGVRKGKEGGGGGGGNGVEKERGFVTGVERSLGWFLGMMESEPHLSIHPYIHPSLLPHKLATSKSLQIARKKKKGKQHHIIWGP